jgi:hypothetical protein
VRESALGAAPGRVGLQSIATGLTIPDDDVDLLVKAGEAVARD